jgi:acetyltransferase-like isoleucine patch superfamily enzyme
VALESDQEHAVGQLADHAAIGRPNVISAHPVYQRLYPDGAALTLGSHAKITSRHQLDCSGTVTIGDYASVAGHQTKILTHSVDVRRDAQVAHPVAIGAYSLVGARALLLGGAVLPDHSVLGAGSVLTRSRTAPEPGLWAGVPATLRGSVEGKWFSRSATGTSRLYIPSTGETVEGAI